MDETVVGSASYRDGDPNRWTFRLAVVVIAALVIGVLAVVGLLLTGRSDERVFATEVESAMAAERLWNTSERESAATRAFLLTGERPSLDCSRTARDAFRVEVQRLRERSAPPEAGIVDQIELAHDVYESASERAILLRKNDAPPADVSREFESEVRPSKSALDGLLLRLSTRTTERVAEARRASAEFRDRIVVLVSVVASLAVAVAGVLAVLLRRVLSGLAHERGALTRSVAALEQSNRDLDAFAGRVAHDLRNALSPLVVGTRLMRARNKGDDVSTLCDRLDRSAQRAMGIVDALLAFSRVERQADAAGSASVREVLAAVLEELEPRIAQADARIEQAVEDLRVRCPPGLLHVLLANVLGNAVKFVCERSVREVRITGRPQRGGCEIRIDDSGPGIPEGARAHIFEPFYRAPGTTVPGSGIGLATVRRVLDAQHGRIGVVSKEGQGTSFLLWLPLAGEGLGARNSPTNLS